MASWDGKPSAQAQWFTQLCAGAALGTALLAVTGWQLDMQFLAGQWGEYIPMAPSTALAFILLFYGGAAIPVALPTALAFVLLGMGESGLAMSGAPAPRAWSGDSISRKHMLLLEVLDLNATVSNMTRILRRLVSEDIEIVARLDPTVAPVMADRHQIEQVVIILGVNARDAMPSGGALTLETGQRHREGVCGAGQEEIRPGTYVELTVRDTGVGMDAHTLEHLFEPFFTTKNTGKGTGLGMSTVHGIVIQCGAHVGVESEVGKGSAIHIYLPVTGRPTEDPSPLPVADIEGGAETILLVEDQVEVRRFIATILGKYGYRVVEAVDADQALR